MARIITPWLKEQREKHNKRNREWRAGIGKKSARASVEKYRNSHPEVHYKHSILGMISRQYNIKPLDIPEELLTMKIESIKIKHFRAKMRRRIGYYDRV
jgi:hypothetical protein